MVVKELEQFPAVIHKQVSEHLIAAGYERLGAALEF